MSRFAENSVQVGRKSSMRSYVQECLQKQGEHDGRRGASPSLSPAPVLDFEPPADM
jgi:hypothetical protein